MGKINITKQTGEKESYTLISAFKEANGIYVILDSERVGSMGLPIIYVSKFTNKLEKISDANEWQSVKNALKGIINGTNFQYVKIDENVMADEAYYTPLTLPAASFDLIKSRYVVTDDNTSEGSAPVLEKKEVSVNDLINEMAPNFTGNTKEEVPVTPVIPNVVPNSNQSAAYSQINPTPVTPVEPVISNVTPIAPSITPTVSNVAPVVENPTLTPAPVVTEIPVVPNAIPVTQPVTPTVSQNVTPNVVSNNIPETPVAPVVNQTPISKKDTFDMEKETFMKACENMFDALMGKYERKLSDLEAKEQMLVQKEQEIEIKLQNASEHLANAEAREQVANIAHDNAQKIMDISNLMPNNPNIN